MQNKATALFAAVLFVSLLLLPGGAAAGERRYALPLYGDPKYPAGFTHFDYVNPDAPKGGEVKLAETGNFDSVNQFILKGVKAPGVPLIFDTLMVGSLDEPQVMYGLVAESVTVAPDNKFAEFFLRKEAKFHDGTPITPEDVVFSYETLKEKGDPTFKILFAGVQNVEKAGDHAVKFTFSDPKNRELPQIVAAIPILSKAYYTAHDFEKTTFDPPLSSGPYEIDNVDPGRSITYRRVPNYWAQNLPVNKGQNNFDVIHYDMYRDENVSLEAFKAGAFDFRREFIARSWATGYDTPALRDGRLIKRAIPDGNPQGMQSFLFNLRQSRFADERVREAIALTMDFEWLNRTIFYDAYARNTSFFENTEFAATGAPEGEELALLEPFRDSLPEGVFTDQWKPPVTDGSGNARENLLHAQALLDDAGWVVKDGKRVNAKTGEKLTIEFLLHQTTMERVVGPMRKNLERLGIPSTMRLVDDSQYKKREDDFDFDIVSSWINRGVFFPGNDQMTFWHSSQADIKGSNNLAGLKNAAVDAALEKLTTAKDKASLAVAAHALDRVLLWENVAIPNWHSNSFRIAYWDKFGMPKIAPKYDIGLMTWWIKPVAANQKPEDGNQ